MNIISKQVLQYLRYACTTLSILLLIGQESIAQCAPLSAVTLPFVEDFESTTNTTLVATGNLHCGTDHQWDFETTAGRIQFGTDVFFAKDGNGAFIMESPGGASVNSAILTLDMTGYIGHTGIYLSFDIGNLFDNPDAGDRVWIRGSDTDPWVEIYDWSTLTELNYVSVTGLDLDATLSGAGQAFGATFGVRFGNEETPSSPFNGLSVDNVTITTCPAPNTLTAANVTPISADLSWTEPGTATIWDLEWGTAGFSLGGGTMANGLSSTSYSLTGLTAGTEYQFYVRSDCGGGGNSLWTGPYSFVTPCAASTVFTEDFESTTNTTLTATGNLHTAADYRWDFETDAGGRIMFGTNSFIGNNSNGAFALDNPAGQSINYAILTLDMTGQTGINLSFSILDPGDDVSPNDRVWVRGTDADSWVELYDWHAAASGGTFVDVMCLDVDAALSGAGQVAGATFGVRFGQEDDQTFDSGVGIVIDDVSITAAAISTPAVPTLGEWGLILLGLLVAIFGVLAIRQSEIQLAFTEKTITPSHFFPMGLPFDKTVFNKMLVAVMLGLVAVFSLAIALLGYEMTTADVPGCLIAGPLLAYLLQLLAVERES